MPGRIAVVMPGSIAVAMPGHIAVVMPGRIVVDMTDMLSPFCKRCTAAPKESEQCASVKYLSSSSSLPLHRHRPLFVIARSLYIHHK